MSIKVINLRKLLRFFMAPPKERISLLRADIRSDIKKENGGSAGGGDFFVPFWASSKAHVRGEEDLTQATANLIAVHRGRKRLYPMLTEGFLEWWNEKRRWRNELFIILDENVRCQYRVTNLNLVIKIENLISVQVGDQSYRLAYPYFSELPAVSNSGARLGIYLLHRALPQFSIDDFRILDVLRANSFSTRNITMLGTEEEEFLQAYNALQRQWMILRSEYD